MGDSFMGVARWKRTLVGVLLSGAALGACVRPRTGSSAIVLVDDAGDTVHLAAPAHRIVSLIPATTELLFAIGAGPHVVGRTTWCDYPPEASAVPNMGDGIRPNLEAILAQHPDLVVLYQSAQNGDAARRLRELGIPEVRLAVDRLTDVDRIAGILGRLTGTQRGADSLAAVFDTALSHATARADSSTRPRVLILVWDQPPMTLGAGSFLSELVDRAGAVNLFSDIGSSSAQVSVEAVVARNPDLVLVASEGTPAFAERPEWQPVRAIRERRFVRLTSSAFSRPSPRAPDAIRNLTALIADAAR
jgi:ABC-type Fe3+-hydroxamate transport system substrate-binding protein